MRPVKIQISLRIRAVLSEVSLGAFQIAKDAKFLRADKEESDQTATDAQNDHSLHWVYVSKGTFSHLKAYSVFLLLFFFCVFFLSCSPLFVCWFRTRCCFLLFNVRSSKKVCI